MRTPFLSSVLVLIVRMATAQPIDVPLANWTVPPYRATSGGGITTMVDQTPPRAFIGLPVCRLLDTRPPVNNPLDGDGIFATDQIRTYTLPGSCGIPSGTDAVSLNITVTNTVSNPFGHIKIWPADQAEPNVSTLNWSTGGVTESNAAIVALSVTPAGQIKVKSGNAGADVIIDVNGYFSDTLGTQGNSLQLISNSTSSTASFENQSTSCAGACGLYVTAASGNAIYGLTTDDIGGVGVSGTSTGTGSAAGVYGIAFSPSGWGGAFVNFAAGVGARGVAGNTGSVANNSAGVQGSNGGVANLPGSFTTAGVRGETVDAGYGVLGLTTGPDSGVAGFFINSANTNALSGGYLGLGPSTGVFFFNGLSGTGTKSFIEPHPTDASKVIKFISLEGNEAGTFFRGRGRFQNGLATIDVPQDFRMTTSSDDLGIQVTPIGRMATVAVQSIGLDRIVVRGSRDVEFFYLVNGVRRAYPKEETIVENERYLVPRSADARIPEYLSPDERQRMISNGTYHPDGTVNMETARRLGWDKIWEQRSRPAPQPTMP